MQKDKRLDELSSKEQIKVRKEWEQYSGKQEFINQICQYCKNRADGCHNTCNVRANLDAALMHKSITVYTHSTFIGYLKATIVALKAAIRQKKIYYLIIKR